MPIVYTSGGQVAGGQVARWQVTVGTKKTKHCGLNSKFENCKVKDNPNEQSPRYIVKKYLKAFDIIVQFVHNVRFFKYCFSQLGVCNF